MKKIAMMWVLAMAVSASAAEKKATKTEEAEAAKAGFATTLNAGLTMTDGNSETMAANVALKTEGEREGLGSVIAGAEFNYGESTVSGTAVDPATGESVATESKETTVENAKIFANVKKTLSPKTFAYLDGSVLYDDVALIDYRATLGPGLGVYLLKNDKRTLTLEAGPSYVWEQVDGANNDYLALRFAQRYACQATKTAKLVQSLEYLPEAEDFDNYLLVGEIGVEAAINDHLSLRVVLQNKYDSTPAPGAERNDLSLIAGLGFTL
jgi:putative salt-induced outer membrane protein YdiY